MELGEAGRQGGVGEEPPARANMRRLPALPGSLSLLGCEEDAPASVSFSTQHAAGQGG